MPVIVVCGVSGSGKTTIGLALAKRLSARFVEGDDFHSEKNLTKMSSGIPLTDSDRTDWLAAICGDISSHEHQTNVLACSALTSYVQNYLTQKLGNDIMWVKLNLTRSSAEKRMKSRDHFMPPSLMDSQFESWNPPKSGVSVSAENPVDDIVDEIIQHLIAIGDS